MSVLLARKRIRTISVALGSAAFAFAAVLSSAPAAQALPTTKVVTVMAQTQRQANPNLKANEFKGWYAKGTRVTLICYTYGQAVKGWGSPWIPGGWDSLWYKTSAGTYSADVDLATGSNGPAIATKCGSTTPAPATTPIASFYNKVKGTSVANAAGGYRGECVSLVSQYLLQVRGLRTGAWGHAIAYRAGGSGGNQMKAAGWTWHTDRNFRDGDVLVWGSQVGVNGHMAVWYAGKMMQQNFAGRPYVTLDPFYATGYLGYWRK